MRSFPQELQIETRIIGGQEAWAHSWPWQVSLQFSSMSACGGAIINPLWVISAAHCFKRSEVTCCWSHQQVGVDYEAGLMCKEVGLVFNAYITMVPDAEHIVTVKQTETLL